MKKREGNSENNATWLSADVGKNRIFYDSSTEKKAFTFCQNCFICLVK